MDCSNILERIPKVHFGFYKQFLALQKNIDIIISENKLKNDNNIQIYFIRVSLGGAIATIASLYYSSKYPKYNITCITFGNPKVGDNNFKHYFDKRVINSYRIINNYDIVPYLPFFNYSHVKGLKWINNNNIEEETYIYKWSLIRNFVNYILGIENNCFFDHKCINYINNIKKIKNI